MTSRERILTALNHREPDRVPIDLGGHRSSGISAMAYPKLRAALGLEPRPVYVYDPIQQLAVVDEDVLDWSHADAIELGRGFCREEKWWADWTLPDGTPCKMPVWAVPERCGQGWLYRSSRGHILARMPEGSQYFDQTWWPFLDGPEDLSRIEELFPDHMWTGIASPPGPSVSTPEELTEGARRLRQTTDRAIVGLFGGNLLEMGQFYYRMDNFLMMLAGEPERVHRFLDALVEVHLKNLVEVSGRGRTLYRHYQLRRRSGRTGPAQDVATHVPRVFQAAPRRMWARAKQLAPVKVIVGCQRR